jgi:hypothetical protein
MTTTATFDTASINAALRGLYEKKLPAALEELLKLAVTQKRHISHPLLGEVTDHYVRSTTRLVVVGQQTQTWCEWLDATRTVEGVIARSFEMYALAMKGEGDPYATSPFWTFSREVYARCNPGVAPKPHGFFWTNLWKVDDNAGPPQPDLLKLLREHFCLLREEIEVLRPHAVLCFTKPCHDPDLRRVLRDDLPDLKPLNTSEPVSQASLSAGGPVLIRTYHPNHLRWKGRDFWSETLDQVVKLAVQSRTAEGAR